WEGLSLGGVGGASGRGESGWVGLRLCRASRLRPRPAGEAWRQPRRLANHKTVPMALLRSPGWHAGQTDACGAEHRRARVTASALAALARQRQTSGEAWWSGGALTFALWSVGFG